MRCRLFASSLLLWLAAYAQNPSASDMARICADHGCFDRP
ncbi:hypothetical protein BTI_3065 [Burkholderia thailandensis MSMB121]|nr:hypothetical protein BTI_3065 [Burkholderia thailandensis MSMB121]